MIAATLIVSSSVPVIAGADSGSGSGDLSSITNGVSIASAQNEISANIDDFQNDLVQLQTPMNHACRDTTIETIVLSEPFVPSPDLPYWTVEAFGNGNFKGVTLLQSEQDQLQTVLNSPNDTDAAKIQNAISLQTLMMRVSGRTYAKAIETYKLRASGSETFSKLFGVADRCNQYKLQLIRDNDMIKASQKLLALYEAAEKAEAAAIEAIVAKLP